MQSGSTATMAKPDEQRVEKLHKEAIVIDGSIVIDMVPDHFERVRAGNVTAVNHTVTDPYADLLTSLKEIEFCRRWIAENAEHALLVRSVADIHEAKRSGREGVIFGPQNTEMIGTDLAFLGTFYDLGVRILQLTYQRQNWVGSGCGEKRDGGLTTFGRKMVGAMDELGILVDLSHCGAVTSRDAIELSRNPVIFSHAHPSAIAPNVRAKDDDLLRAMAAKGGVIGVTALSAFCCDPARPKVRPGLADMVKHIRYLVDLLGIDHVGVALDFEETNTPEHYEASVKLHPEIQSGWAYEEKRIHDLTEVKDLPNLTRAMVVAGFTDDEIRKVLGLNFMRVFKHVWR
jgi:membrane dipeptidase